MKTFLSLWALLASAALSYGAAPTFTVTANGAGELAAPTNLWSANAAQISAALGGAALNSNTLVVLTNAVSNSVVIITNWVNTQISFVATSSVARFTYCRVDDNGNLNHDAQKLYADNWQLTWFNRTRAAQKWAVMTNVYSVLPTNLGAANIAWIGPNSLYYPGVYGTNSYDSIYIWPGYYRVTVTYPMGSYPGFYHAGLLLVSPTNSVTNRFRWSGSPVFCRTNYASSDHSFTAYFYATHDYDLQVEVYTQLDGGGNLHLGEQFISMPNSLTNVSGSYVNGGPDFFEWQTIEIQKIQ